MSFQDRTFKGNFTASGTVYWGDAYGDVSIDTRGVVTAILSADADGNISGTWSFSGTSTYSGIDPDTQQAFEYSEPEYDAGTATGVLENILFFEDGDGQIGDGSFSSETSLSGKVYSPQNSPDNFFGELVLNAEDSGSDGGGGPPDDNVIIDGTDADETITGGSGEDTLEGGAGDDTVEGGAGDDTVEGGAGDDIVEGDEGDDALAGGEGDDNLFGGTGDDSVEGDAGDDNLFGGTGTDSIVGGDGDDILDGGSGTDSMVGGAGADTYYVDNSKDIVKETDNLPAGSSGFILGIDLASTIDTVIASVSYTLTNYVENLALTDGGTKKLSGTGNELGNLITGNATSNKLAGKDGADTIDGGAGADKLSGGGSADTFVFSNLATGGADAISDFTSGDMLELDIEVFTALAAAGADNLAFGNAAADADDYLIYNSKGVLSYDADGSGSTSAAIKIVAVKGAGAKALDFADLSFT